MKDFEGVDDLKNMCDEMDRVREKRKYSFVYFEAKVQNKEE